MSFLLELKEKFFALIGKREKWSLAAVKFVIALVVFTLINQNVGYMDALENPILVVAMSIICAFTPIAVTIFLGVVLLLVHFYALAMELCLIALLLFVLMFVFHFRFTKNSGYYAILTPIFCFLRIPYVIPNAVGMTGKPYNAISVICGTMAYFLIKNVRENEALFRSFDEAIYGSSKFTLAINQIFVNEEMFLYMIAFIVAAIVVYCVRRLPIDYSWSASVLSGSVAQLIIVGGGMIAFGSPGRVLIVFVGSLIGLGLSAGLMFIIHPLDYSRVERVEFEDEEYYYYVKAVPKAYVAVEEREVKQIASKKHKAVKGTGRLKKNDNVQVHTEVSEKTEEEKNTKHTHKSNKTKKNKNSKKAQNKKTKTQIDDIAKKAMDEFDVEGEWLD